MRAPGKVHQVATVAKNECAQAETNQYMTKMRNPVSVNYAN